MSNGYQRDTYRTKAEREQDVIAFIREYMWINGYSPGFREIKEGCAIGSTSVVAFVLDTLEGRGVLRRTDGIARSIVLLGGGA